MGQASVSRLGVMQYFVALKTGQKRVASAREYLNGLTGGKAMPALALADTKSGVWEPVGEENLYAFVDSYCRLKIHGSPQGLS